MKNKITLVAALLLGFYLVNAQTPEYNTYGNGSLRLLSERYKVWSTQNFQWDDSDSAVYNYNTQGWESEKHKFNSPANGWNSFSLITKTYTASGKILVSIDSIFASPPGCYRAEHNYNTNDQETLLTTYKLFGGNWTFDGRNQTNYTAFDSVNVVLTQYYINNIWENSSRVVHTYNPQNRDTLSTREIWKNNQWRGDSRVTTPLNSNGQIVSATNQQYDTVSASYKNYNQRIYTFDANNRLSSSTYKLWNSANNSWLNVTKTSYAYDANGNLENILGESWDIQNLSWELSTLATYSYDAGGKQTSYLYQTRDGSSWKNYSEATYTYNAQGYLINTLQQGWDENTLAWRNYSDWAYYYEANPLFNGIEETEKTKLFVYPNPSNGPVSFINADKNMPYEIYDLQGRIVQQGKLQPGTNSIILYEAKGMYLLKAGNSTVKLVKE